MLMTNISLKRFRLGLVNHNKFYIYFGSLPGIIWAFNDINFGVVNNELPCLKISLYFSILLQPTPSVLMCTCVIRSSLIPWKFTKKMIKQSYYQKTAYDFCYRQVLLYWHEFFDLHSPQFYNILCKKKTMDRTKKFQVTDVTLHAFWRCIL